MNRYRSLSRKLFKIRWGLFNKVQDHHVIPKHLKYHPVLLKLQFDINSSKNLIMMPTDIGMKTFQNIRKDRLVHKSGHVKYNRFVKNLLDGIKSEEEFNTIHEFLKHNCRFNTDNIPWN